MSNKLDEIIGNKYRLLTVVSYGKSSTIGGTVCYCKCDCGGTREVRPAQLKAGLVPSCGCLKKKRVRNSALRRQYSSYRQNAKQRGIKFNLSEEQFEHITSQSCHYCKVEPEGIREMNGDTYVYNGVDRIDSSLDYDIDNVVPCCTICNHGKNNMSYDDFISYLRRIAKIYA